MAQGLARAHRENLLVPSSRIARVCRESRAIVTGSAPVLSDHTQSDTLVPTTTR